MIRLRNGNTNAHACAAVVSYQGRILADALPAFVGLLSAGIDVAVLSGDAVISRARSKLATELVDRQGYGLVLWIDDDILFAPHQAIEVLKLAKLFNSIVGGMYARRGSGGEPCCELEPAAPMTVRGDATDGESVFLAPARWMGTGFLAVPAEVFALVRERFGMTERGGLVPYFMPALIDGVFAGEDVSFCARAAEAGARLLMHVRASVVHRESVDTVATFQPQVRREENIK